jgi:hypothetical protein
MTPASQFRWRTANASTGVGRAAGRRKVSMPAAVKMAAVSAANAAELCRAS